jgi:hypothetical protein
MNKNFILHFNPPEDLDQSLHNLNLISINLNVLMEDFVSTHTRPYLFDCSDFTRHYTRLPRIEVQHDDTWDDFGRAYYDSRDYQFTEFHVTLCSVDEMKQQIEAWVQQYEQIRVLSDIYRLAEPVVPSFFERYYSQRHWNEELYAWIEDFQAHCIIERKLWMADEHHSCHPYEDTTFYLHQLAKLILSGHNPQTSAASRPCCRSFLMASCRQLSGDDLLGH